MTDDLSLILVAAELGARWLEYHDRQHGSAKAAPHRDAHGRFARSGAGTGHHAKRGNRSHQDPRKVRSPEHAEQLKISHHERREHASDIRSERRQLRTDQVHERRSLKRRQERETAKLGKDQERGVAKLGREQDRETAKLTARHDRETAKASTPTPHALEKRHAEERAELTETHENERSGLHEEHVGDRRTLAEEHRDDRISQRQDHREERASQRQEHLDSITDLRAHQRQDLADTHYELRIQRARKAQSEKGWLTKDRDLQNPDGAGGADDEPDHSDEENTFDLPDGDDIAAALRLFFAKQAKHVLGTIPTIGEPLPEAMPDLADYDEPMHRAMTPLISAYWSEAGQAIRDKIGLEPDAWPRSWAVSDPHTKSKIESAAMAFCRSTNATTTDTLTNALRRLKEELKTGVVDEGEGVRELGKRVNGIFTGLSKSHARMIGQTEASRAVHQAQEASVMDSDVVQGAEWLLSANACSRCHRIKDEVGRVKLGENFAVIGNNPDYKDIRVPPGHPRCRCSVLWIISKNYGGPEKVKWGKPLIIPSEDDDADKDENDDED